MHCSTELLVQLLAVQTACHRRAVACTVSAGRLGTEMFLRLGADRASNATHSTAWRCLSVLLLLLLLTPEQALLLVVALCVGCMHKHTLLQRCSAFVLHCLL
jgi:hypothetical protein